ncbi:MAG: DUF4175 family protein [Bacteroidales bacterium]
MEPVLNEILSKIEKFIQKYLLYKIIRGVCLSFGLALVIGLTASSVEYYNFSEIITKTIIFYLIVATFVFLFVYYIVLPLLSLIKLRNSISKEEAAKIISEHFSGIDDKLINTIQLGTLINTPDANSDLLIASIKKRTEELRPFVFSTAVNFNYFKKYLFFLGFSVFLLGLIYSFKPALIEKGSYRLINYSTYFEPEAPFKFVILNKNLNCEKGKDFNLDIRVVGEYIPDEVYIKIGENSFLLNKGKDLSGFSFTIRNLNNPVEFRFIADKYKSEYYKIDVLPSPVLKSFFVDIVPPSYTGLERKRITNTGDLNIPSGSMVTWNFMTANVDNLAFVLNKDTSKYLLSNPVIEIVKQISQNSTYSVSVKNKSFVSDLVATFSIEVIPDVFPEIEITSIEDSLELGSFYFLVKIKDDYGFHNLNFVRKLIAGDSVYSTQRNNLAVSDGEKSQELVYHFNFNDSLSLTDDQFVEYYFEVKDNDFINGYKTTRSVAKVFKPLSREEIRDKITSSEKETEKALNKGKDLSKDIEREIEEFKRKELSNNLNEWEKENYLKNILEKQKDIEKLIEKAKKDFTKTNQFDNQFYEDQKNAVEKQQQIEKLLDEIMDEELKSLLEEIKQLTEKFDEEKFNQLKDKVDFSYKNLQKKLDRTLELLKRYQVEENLLRNAEDLQNLSEKQMDLSEQKNSEKKEDIIKNQNNLNQEFKEIEKDFNENLEKNEQLKDPYGLENSEEMFEEIKNDLNKLDNSINESTKKNTQKKQKEISEKMDELSDNLKKMFDEMTMEQQEENLENLRQLIDNLNIFSFNQEETYNLLNKNLPVSSNFAEIIEKQNKVKNDFDLINDSLYNLAERIAILGQNILRESESIKYNAGQLTKDIEARKRREALSKQRLVMKSANTLALMLEELLKQMENMSGGQGGSKKKSGKQQQMDDLKGQQKKLKEQLQKLLDEMKKNEGNANQMNKSIVEALAEQEIFNKILKELMNGKGVNPDEFKKLQEIKQLSDKNIDDLINKKITPELYNRNQRILTRLLESEKAEKEREQEQKRESKEGRKDDIVIPDEIKESLKKDQRYKESLKKNQLNLRKYYHEIEEEYFKKINK